MLHLNAMQSNSHSPPDVMYPTLYGNHQQQRGVSTLPSATRIKVGARGTSIDMACQTDSSTTDGGGTMSPMRVRRSFKHTKGKHRGGKQEFSCKEAIRDVHLHGIRKLFDAHPGWIRR